MLKVDIEKNLGSFCLKVKFETSGDITSFLGASGSGKSITLKCIAGILKPDKGQIILNDRVLFDSEKHINLPIQKRNVGYFFQDYALFPNMSVKQNIYMGMKRFGRKYDKESKYNEIVKLLNIEGLSNRKPHQISGGQKQRVALARILVNEPEIILLDEPFSALDEHLRTRLQIETKETLEKLHKEAILVTHNRDEAYIISSHSILISQGQIVEMNDTDLLFANPTHVESAVLTGCKNFSPVHIEGKKLILDDWGFAIKGDADEETKFIGIRAHHFSPNEKENAQAINIIDVIDTPFEKLVRFRFKNQKEESPNIYWFVDKNVDVSKIKKVGFKTEHVLKLK